MKELRGEAFKVKLLICPLFFRQRLKVSQICGEQFHTHFLDVVCCIACHDK